MLNIILEFDGKLTTANKIYKIGRGGQVYLAPEVKAFRDRVAPLIVKQMAGQKYGGSPLIVTAHVYSDWFLKAAKYPPGEKDVRMMDIDNFIKATLDSVFAPMKINDKMIFDLRIIKKQHKGLPFVRMHIREIYPDELEGTLYGEEEFGATYGAGLRRDSSNDASKKVREYGLSVRPRQGSRKGVHNQIPVEVPARVLVQSRSRTRDLQRRA